jgi:hypothetical protein
MGGVFFTTIRRRQAMAGQESAKNTKSGKELIFAEFLRAASWRLLDCTDFDVFGIFKLFHLFG